MGRIGRVGLVGSDRRVALVDSGFHVEAWQARNSHGGIDADDVTEIVRRNTQGKVSFVPGDDETSLPGRIVRIE